MALTQQDLSQLRGLISSMPPSPAAYNVAYAFMQWESSISATGATSQSPQPATQPAQRRRGRPAATKVAKTSPSAAQTRRTTTAASPTSPMTQVLKRIVNYPGITTQRLCSAFPKIRPNHMGINLTRLTKNGSITGTVKTGPWTATESGVAAVNAPAVTNLGQARQRRGRPARATTHTPSSQQEELQQTGT